MPKQSVVQKCSTQEEAEEAVGNTENLTIIQTMFNSSYIWTSNLIAYIYGHQILLTKNLFSNQSMMCHV